MSFSNYSLSINLLVLIVAACAVWVSGTKIAGYADELADRFGWSRALLGLLLLAGVTSLPEIATSFTAAYHNSADLAVNNLLGSIAMQVTVLAVADLTFGQRALTSMVPDPVVMLQGALNIVLLAMVAIAVSVGDIPLLGAGAWSWGLLAAAGYSFKKLVEVDGQQPWIVNPDEQQRLLSQRPEENPLRAQSMRRHSHAGLAIKTFISALIILVAGYIVASVGDVIAVQSGLGASFVGMVLVAITTSLPEVSTVFACVRRGLYTMAISDILGTNILNITLLFGVDLIAAGEPVLSRMGQFSVIGALLGLLVTALFLMGLAERADRTIGRMGVDSFAVLLTYGGGLILLYWIR